MNHPGNLAQIRLELRGPIKPSPFAGKCKQLKLDYCDRQINVYLRQFRLTGEMVFNQLVMLWKTKRVWVELNKI